MAGTENSKSPLLRVAEGILDSGEYIESNLKTANDVADYALNGVSISLDDDEAEKVRAVCASWVEKTESGELNGTCDYYYSVEEPLSE